VNPSDLQEQILAYAQMLDEALAFLRGQTVKYADSDNAYRLAHARAYLASDGPVNERKATADLATDKERHAAHLAEGMRQAALEAVRSRRAQLSALQTLANSYRAEAEFVRTAP